MSRRKESIYSLTPLARAMKDDPRMLAYLMKSGEQLNTVLASGQVDEVLSRHIMTPDFNVSSTRFILNAAVKSNDLSRSRVIEIISDIRRDNPEGFRGLVGTGIGVTLIDMLDDGTAQSEKDQILDLVYSATENSDSEYTAASTFNYLARYGWDNLNTTRALDRILDLTIRYGDTSGSTTAHFLDRIKRGGDGRLSPSRTSMLAVLNDILMAHPTIDAFDKVKVTNLAPGLNMLAIAARLSSPDGEVAINYLQEAGLSDRELTRLLDRTHVGARDKPTGEVISWIYASNTDLTESQRIELLDRLMSDFPDIAERYIGIIKNHFEATLKHLKSGLGHPKYGMSLSESFIRNCNPQDLRYVVLALSDASNPNPYRVPKRFTETLMTHMSNLLNGRGDGEPTEGLINDYWAYISMLSIDKHGKDTIADIKVSLIQSGLLSQETLDSVSSGNSKIAKAARAALSGRKKQEKIESVSGWDQNVDTHTSFQIYMGKALAADISPISALALYATDSRIEFQARVEARSDLIALLNEVPEYAEDVPERAWTGLSRVREHLGLTMDLANHLMTLGGAAARVGSKNLVRSAIL